MPRVSQLVFTPVIAAILLAGCAGRPANPISVSQIGDESRSCDALIAELSQIDADVARKLPDTKKTGTNIALGVAGIFFLVPWFFMDFTESEQIEIEALRNRYTRLNSIAADKGCGKAPSEHVDTMGKAIDAAKAKRKEAE